MGSYDNVGDARIRQAIRQFAQMVAELDRRGELLHATPRVQKALGDLRQMLFAYEVRLTPRLPAPPDVAGADSDLVADPRSVRIVEEARARNRAFLEELGGDPPPDRRV